MRCGHLEAVIAQSRQGQEKHTSNTYSTSLDKPLYCKLIKMSLISFSTQIQPYLQVRVVASWRDCSQSPVIVM